ncbi:IS4 family transposase [Spirochaetia bacterium]|nr:IS4 family transposase [Spirochaetia bacterium]
MNKHTTVLSSLTSHLSRSEFEKAVKDHQGDKGVRALKTYDFFKMMAYGQLSGSFSVREIENSMKANSTKLYHAGLPQLKRSTFCDAMEKRDSHIFEDVFHAVVSKAQCIAGRALKRFKNPLRIIDASTISLCLSKFDWAAYRKAKGAVKLHLNLDGDNLISYDAYLSCGKVHDVHGMAELCREPGVIYVLDRGYVDYKSLYDIELRGSFFVTRMKSNGKYKRIKNNPHAKDGPIVSDVVIQMTGNNTRKQYPKELRKVRYYDKEFHHTYEFITNNFTLAAQEIADIYKARWQVELFFKWIKQHLKIKSFWGTSENAVFTQIWVALILSVLLWICRTLEGISASAHQILQMIKTTLLSKNSVFGLCTNTTSPPEIYSSQLLLEGVL